MTPVERVVCELGAGEHLVHALVAERMRRVEPALVAFATLAGIGLDFSKLCFHKTRVTSGYFRFPNW